MTPIKYALTVEDLVKGMRVGMQRHLRRRWWKFALFVIFVAAVIPLGVVLWDGLQFSDWLEGFWKLLAIYTLLAVIFIILVYYWLTLRRARKQFKQMPMLAREQHFHWDTQHLHFKSTNGETRYPFAEIHKCYADDTMILLYPSDHIFYLLPRHIFAEQSQYDDLVQTIKNSGVQWM